MFIQNGVLINFLFVDMEYVLSSTRLRCACEMGNVVLSLTQQRPLRATKHDQCDIMMCATTVGMYAQHCDDSA